MFKWNRPIYFIFSRTVSLNVEIVVLCIQSKTFQFGNMAHIIYDIITVHMTIEIIAIIDMCFWREKKYLAANWLCYFEEKIAMQNDALLHPAHETMMFNSLTHSKWEEKNQMYFTMWWHISIEIVPILARNVETALIQFSWQSHNISNWNRSCFVISFDLNYFKVYNLCCRFVFLVFSLFGLENCLLV